MPTTHSQYILNAIDYIRYAQQNYLPEDNQADLDHLFNQADDILKILHARLLNQET